MSVGRYVGLTASVAVLTAGPAIAFLDLDDRARLAVALGASLATLNSVAAYVLAVLARRRSSLSAFMLFVLGGMGARLGLMLGAVAVAMFWWKLPQTALVASVATYFALFLVLELAALQMTPRTVVAEAR